MRVRARVWLGFDCMGAASSDALPPAPQPSAQPGLWQIMMFRQGTLLVAGLMSMLVGYLLPMATSAYMGSGDLKTHGIHAMSKKRREMASPHAPKWHSVG